MLGVHPKTAIRLFRRREIPAFRPGGKLWRTTREAVQEYIAANLRAARLASRSASLCRELPRDPTALGITDRAKR